jgi:hypothetical protein
MGEAGHLTHIGETIIAGKARVGYILDLITIFRYLVKSTSRTLEYIFACLNMANHG